jgi:hypothetical protein
MAGASADVSVVLEGFTELQRALKHADKSIRLGIRKEFRDAVEPVRAMAEELAVARIRGLEEGDPWSKMRVGITQNSVYVAPRQRGRKGGRRGRTQARHHADQLFADMLMSRAMEAALYQHGDQAVHDIERMLDRVCDRFNHGGPLG